MPLQIFRPGSPDTPIARDSEGRLRLQAEHTHTIAGDPDELTAIAAALPRKLTRRRTAHVLELAFINAVGLFDLPHLGVVEVRTDKFSETDFAAMLAQIADEVAQLPLEAGTLARESFNQDAEIPRLAYLSFLYLRHIVSDQAPPHLRLQPALHTILSHPHRRIVREPRWVPLERARHVDPGRLHQLLTPRAGLARSHSPLALAASLRGHLPSLVEETAPHVDLDVPENRFVRHFLDHAQLLVRTFRALAGGRKQHFRDRLAADCDAITRALEPYDRNLLWDVVSPMRRLPLDSTVLQRARGYRDVVGHFIRLRQGPCLPLEPDRVRELLELKNIATLYELWTFFAVVRALRTLLGEPAHAAEVQYDAFDADIAKGFRLTWPQGHAVHYNLAFTRGNRRRFSYSLRLLPDITVEVPDGPNAGLHLFDAKFRQFRPPTDDEPSEDDDPTDPTSFRAEDLHKMHTYRDALAARTVWVLYPGDEFHFYPTAPAVQVVRAADKLPTVLGGVGSVPLIPAHLPDAMVTILKHLTASSAS